MSGSLRWTWISIWYREKELGFDSFCFLLASGLGVIRDDNDPSCTFEGDNNVLLQQGSNYILSAYEDFSKRR